MLVLMPKMGTHDGLQRLLDDRSTLRWRILNTVEANRHSRLAFRPSVPLNGRGYPWSST